MGRGAADTSTTPARRRSGSRGIDKAREQLLADFGQIGYVAYTDLPEGIERDIADPNLDYINKFVDGRPDPPRPYTELFRYAPSMENNHAHFIEVDIRLDHESGDLFVVGRVSKAAGLTKRTGVNRVENAGKDVRGAIEKAQRLYDETFSAFKNSKAGRRADHGKQPRYVPRMPLQVMEFGDRAFYEAEPAIVAALATEGMPAQKAYRARYEAVEEAERRGYAEAKAQGYIS